MPTDPVDIRLGRQLQFFRLRAQLSQTALASQVGVTFQQLQKYEKGANRVSASRLLSLSRVLGITVQEFFDGDAGMTRAKGKDQPALTSKLDHEVFYLACRLNDRRVKRRIRDLLAALVQSEAKGPGAGR